MSNAQVRSETFEVKLNESVLASNTHDTSESANNDREINVEISTAEKQITTSIRTSNVTPDYIIYRPTLQPLVSENLNCRKRKANPDENQAPNRDAELNKVPNSNPEQKENINYNSIEDISSPASKKFHKNLVELQNLEDDLPDYDEMEDRSESDNFGRLIETSSLAESCPDTTLLPLTDEEDNNQIQENSKFTKSFQNR